MARASRDTQGELLNIVSAPKIRTQLCLRSVLLQILQRETQTQPEGEKIRVRLHTAISGAGGYSSAGIIPSPSFQGVASAYYNYKKYYGPISLDASHFEDTKNSTAAIVAALGFEVQQMVRETRSALSFDAYGDGSGLLTDCTSAADAVTLTVESARGLQNGQIVDVLLKSTGEVGYGVLGTKITVDTSGASPVLTLNKNLGSYGDIGATYGVYRRGSYNDAIYGLAAAVSGSNPSGGYYGERDRTLPANADWKANLVDASSAALTPRLIQDAVDKCKAANSDANPDVILVGPIPWNTVAAGLEAKRMYEAKALTLNGWMQAIQFAGINIIKDYSLNPSLAYVLDSSSLWWGQHDAGNWKKPPDGGSIWEATPGHDSYRATWKWRAQLLCDACNKNGLIYGVKTTN